MGKQLTLGNLGLLNQNATVVIYWHQRTGNDHLQNGHSALIINTNGFDQDIVKDNTNRYVSWMGIAGLNPFKFRGVARDFRADMQFWSGSKGQLLPTRWVALSGLDIPKMTLEWSRMIAKEGAHWKVFDKNCATVVHRVLAAGGGDQYATRATKQIVWWPTDLITYARSMPANMIVDSSDN